jgi:hypothetical protein
VIPLYRPLPAAPRKPHRVADSPRPPSHMTLSSLVVVSNECPMRLHVSLTISLVQAPVATWLPSRPLRTVSAYVLSIHSCVHPLSASLYLTDCLH